MLLFNFAFYHPHVNFLMSFHACGLHCSQYTCIVRTDSTLSQVTIGSSDLKANHAIDQVVEVVSEHEKYPKYVYYNRVLILFYIASDPSLCIIVHCL